MITREKFDFILEKYGHWASWAVWAEQESNKPKSNLGDLTILDPQKNKSLLEQINPNVVIVALNFSDGAVKFPLGNFHDNNPVGTAFKLRYALKNTPLWGGYLTDIIKDYDQKESGKVVSYLSSNKSIVRKNVEIFREELKDLGSERPIIMALGNAVYEILKSNLGEEYEILKVPHYASYINKEKYREFFMKMSLK